MKKTLLLTTLAALLTAGASGQNSAALRPITDPTGRFGVGLMVGEPSGVSLKYFWNETMAVDGAVGWSFHRETDLYLHSDVLWHDFDLLTVPQGQLPVYLGVGARAKIREHKDDRLGVRVPVGVSYLFEDLPLDIFAEVAPILDFAPSTRGGFTLGIGARWWF